MEKRNVLVTYPVYISGSETESVNVETIQKIHLMILAVLRDLGDERSRCIDVFEVTKITCHGAEQNVVQVVIRVTYHTARTTATVRLENRLPGTDEEFGAWAKAIAGWMRVTKYEEERISNATA